MLTYDVEVVELQRQPAAVVRGHVAVTDLPAFLGGAFAEVMQAIGGQQISVAGPPFGRYTPAGDGFDAEVGFPTTADVAPTGRVEPSELPGGFVAVLQHRGDYSALGAAYEAGEQWLADHGYVGAGPPWESYLDGPEVPEPRTVVSFPCTKP